MALVSKTDARKQRAFVETYRATTAFFVAMRDRADRSPLFLPRSLSYRCDAQRRKRRLEREAAREAKRPRAPVFLSVKFVSCTDNANLAGSTSRHSSTPSEWMSRADGAFVAWGDHRAIPSGSILYPFPGLHEDRCGQDRCDYSDGSVAP